MVAEAIEAPQLLRETLRARAEGFLTVGLASGASSGNLKLCKLLLEAGASVERSEALHEAVSSYCTRELVSKQEAVSSYP